MSLNRVIAYPRDEPLDHYVVQDRDQLTALTQRFTTLQLYGELDGVVFSGDLVTAEHLQALQFWWVTRVA